MPAHPNESLLVKTWPIVKRMLVKRFVINHLHLCISLTDFTHKDIHVRVLVPNLSDIVGTTTSAKLLGVADGLGGLAKMPSCNIRVDQTTFAAHKEKLQQISPQQPSEDITGFIFQCDLVSRTINSKCSAPTARNVYLPLR